LTTEPRPVASISALLLAIAASRAHATSTVFSPDVDAGTSALDYRISYVPSDAGRRSAFTQRLHYQRAFDGAWRGRIIGTQGRRGSDDLEYRYTRLELQWQYLEDERAGWDAALRFELQVAAESDRPDRFRLAWTGKTDVGGLWQLRANVTPRGEACCWRRACRQHGGCRRPVPAWGLTCTAA